MPEKSNKILLGVISMSVLVILISLITYLARKNNSLTNNKNLAVENTPLVETVPSSAKSPEEFMQKIQEKAKENQKNYDSNLTEFAGKKWQKIFTVYNSIDNDFLVNNLKVLDRVIQKEDDGSTVFRIKYRIGNEGAGNINEDYFFLVISESKRDELGLASLKPNVFLSEDDIKNNISKAGFAKITKINK